MIKSSPLYRHLNQQAYLYRSARRQGFAAKKDTGKHNAPLKYKEGAAASRRWCFLACLFCPRFAAS